MKTSVGWIVGLVSALTCLNAVSCSKGAQAPKSSAQTGVVLVAEDEDALPQDPPAPKIRHNQVGYLPNQPKFAVVGSDSKTPLDWSLVDDKGAVVASGKTTPRGLDADSGDSVHQIDFSTYKGT
ncbi:MAG TPA: cellulase N-terminal Ig-like domain-containing protein, partial [Polyangiaceae bacterium]